MEGSGVVKATNDYVLLVILITMLTIQSEIRLFLNNYERILMNFQDSFAMI